MKYVIALITFALAVQPALAWQLNSDVGKKSWSHAAFQADKGGGIELQFYCDNEYPDDIQMLVFTDLDSDGSEEEHPSVAVKAVVDDESFEDLSGYYDAVDDERVVVLDTLEEERVRDIIESAQDAKQPLVVDYDGRSHRFGVEDISETLTDFLDGCNS